MAKETFTGPLVSLGGLAGGPSAGQPREYSDEIGPSIFWAGMAIPATGGVANKDRTGPGAIPCVFAAFPMRTINAAPAAGNAAVTVAGNAVAGTPFPNLATYAAGRATGVPVQVSGVSVTNAVGLDMGLDAATFATAGTVTLTTTANFWRYRPGQWICLLNCPANGTQMVQIQTAPSTGVLTVLPVPAAGTTGQIALTNRFNPNAYGASQRPPTGISSSAACGTARIEIPECGTTRGLGVTGVASGTGGAITVVGTDTFGNIQSEIITATAGATTAWGKKTYDTFISATPQFSDAHNYTVVTSDFIGFPMSVMSADSIVSATFAGVALVLSGTTTAVVVPADLTYPATATTGDPRGGLQLTANGPVTGPTGTPPTLNGTNLLVVDQRLNPLQVALATTVNPGPLLGVPPF